MWYDLPDDVSKNLGYPKKSPEFDKASNFWWRSDRDFQAETSPLIVQAYLRPKIRTKRMGQKRGSLNSTVFSAPFSVAWPIDNPIDNHVCWQNPYLYLLFKWILVNRRFSCWLIPMVSHFKWSTTRWIFQLLPPWGTPTCSAVSWRAHRGRSIDRCDLALTRNSTCFFTKRKKQIRWGWSKWIWMSHLLLEMFWSSI